MGDITDMKFILFLECTKEIMVERMESRAASSGDNKRSDDNMETLIKRLETFKEQSLPIIDIYEKENKVRRIDATKSADEVYQ